MSLSRVAMSCLLFWVLQVFGQVSAPLLKVGPGGHHLVDENGTPFQLRGEAAWSLAVQLTREDAAAYFSDRRAKGFNALMVEIINVQDGYAANAPKNAYGDLPFVAEDFRQRNEAYWKHIDYIVDEAANYGMVVLAVPLYLGYGGGSEGWFAAASTAGTEAIRDYGAFLGRRYALRKNIVWVNGGDYRPSSLAIPDALASGIAEVDKSHLITTHWARNSAGTDGNPAWLTLNSSYAGVDNIVPRVQADYARAPALPTFLIEGHYEGSLSGQPSLLTREVRSQAWQAYLSGACGNFYAHHSVWLFGGGWKAALNSPGAQSLAQLNAFFAKREWWRLVPDTGNTLVTSARGSGKEAIAAALADDGSFAVIYCPNGSVFDADLSKLKGKAVKAGAFNPANGETMEFPGSPYAPAKQSFPMPSFNGDPQGAKDWVVLLEAAEGTGIAGRPNQKGKVTRGFLSFVSHGNAMGRGPTGRYRQSATPAYLSLQEHQN